MQNQTISEIAKVMERGLMVIPQKIRKIAGFTKGSYIRVILKNDEIILKPLEYTDRNNPSTGATIRIWPTKVKNKKEGLRILQRMKRPIFSDKDVRFIKKGRKQIEERLKKYDNIS